MYGMQSDMIGGHATTHSYMYVRHTSAIVVDVAPFRPQVQRAVVEEVLAEAVRCQGGPDVQDAILDIAEQSIVARVTLCTFFHATRHSHLFSGRSV